MSMLKAMELPTIFLEALGSAEVFLLSHVSWTEKMVAM